MTLADGLSFGPGAPCQIDAQHASCNVGSLGVTTFVVAYPVSIQIAAGDAGPYTITSSFTSDTLDLNTANNTATFQIDTPPPPPPPSADLYDSLSGPRQRPDTRQHDHDQPRPRQPRPQQRRQRRLHDDARRRAQLRARRALPDRRPARKLQRRQPRRHHLRRRLPRSASRSPPATPAPTPSPPASPATPSTSTPPTTSSA